ncbi:hypothetical protein OC713_02590 [Sweet potato little leaf phytoplasma]|uniref:hypothetical protein n=1 Tax=Candidatus Phytoplasma australasiaticum TaxID=2754999 RepID=UPI0027131DF7|nr:hypothetical protein [Sweet potato little leaf phytoplasma]MDO7987392.1 hypothetical protein [Sweet potato little leaf phytoplasma]
MSNKRQLFSLNSEIRPHYLFIYLINFEVTKLQKANEKGFKHKKQKLPDKEEASSSVNIAENPLKAWWYWWTTSLDPLSFSFLLNKITKTHFNSH